MVWSHEVAAKKIPRENVVASLRCERSYGKFTIVDIQWQDDAIVNKDFISTQFKEKLADYLSDYLNHPHAFIDDENRAYRGYIEGGKDYTHVHSDTLYQIYLDDVQRYCDQNKIFFTHEDNIKLMDTYKTPDFSIHAFCEEMRNENLMKSNDIRVLYELFHAALTSNNTAVTNAILKNHPVLNQVNEFGTSFIHLAAQMGHKESIQFFVDSGYKLTMADKKNKTPLDIAREGKSAACQQLSIYIETEIKKLEIPAKTEIAPSAAPSSEFFSLPPKKREVKPGVTPTIQIGRKERR